MTDCLCIWIEGRLVGRLYQREQFRIGLIYDPDWVAAWRDGRSFPISVALPISAGPEELDATNFVAGLLPDSTRHRTLIAEELGIAEDPSDFAFLRKLGRDCAGALVVIPEGEDHGFANPPGVQPLTEAELADHLRALPRRPLMVDEEQGVTLSLAGVNDKAAVVLSKAGIALPLNGMPSTHIIKVDIPGLPDSIKTEHFCLQLAKSVGIRVPLTRIHKAEDQTFMLMARYDRTRDQKTGRIIRMHQEDFCQALNVPPGRKYQRQGGPTWKDCFALLRNHAQDPDTLITLLKMAIFQFLCGNPDAHAKNYSLLHRAPSGAIQLAPLYDLNNAAAFRKFFKKARPIMAMSIGAQDNPDLLTWDDWNRFALDCKLAPRLVEETLRQQAQQILEELPAVQAAAPACEAIELAARDIADRCEWWSA